MADTKATTVKAPKAPKAPKKTVKLTGKSGRTLVFRARRRQDGKFESYSTYTERDEKTNKTVLSKRGASAVHDSYEQAAMAVDAGVKAAASQGWAPKARSAATRKDSFDLKSLPPAN